MSTLPIELVNQILGMSAQLKNAKYIPSVSSQSGDLQWRFNLQSKGNQSILQMYASRIGHVSEPIRAIIHRSNGSYPYSGKLDVLRVYTDTDTQLCATILITFETIASRYTYLVSDVKLVYGLEQPISKVFDVMQYPVKGMYCYYDVDKKEYTYGSIATMTFKMYGHPHPSNQWLDVKLFCENGFWAERLGSESEQYVIVNDDLEEITELDEVEINEEWDEDWDGLWEPIDINQIPQLEMHT